MCPVFFAGLSFSIQELKIRIQVKSERILFESRLEVVFYFELLSSIGDY